MAMSMSNHDPNRVFRNGSARAGRRHNDGLDPIMPLHRIAEVRRLQGVSMRATRQALALSVEEVRMQENQHFDLLLSELYRWQHLLDVPVCELLSEPRLALSQPVMARASMVKVMKTAASILEGSHAPAMRVLAQRLIEQLLEIMPELAGVAGWPSVGQRRTSEELGRIAQHPLSFAPQDE